MPISAEIKSLEISLFDIQKTLSIIWTILPWIRIDIGHTIRTDAKLKGTTPTGS